MIRYADNNDFKLLSKYDKHICETELRNSIQAKRILVMYKDSCFIGWLRFNLFWDNMPFMKKL